MALWHLPHWGFIEHWHLSSVQSRVSLLCRFSTGLPVHGLFLKILPNLSQTHHQRFRTTTSQLFPRLWNWAWWKGIPFSPRFHGWFLINVWANCFQASYKTLTCHKSQFSIDPKSSAHSAFSPFPEPEISSPPASSARLPGAEFQSATGGARSGSTSLQRSEAMKHPE